MRTGGTDILEPLHRDEIRRRDRMRLYAGDAGSAREWLSVRQRRVPRCSLLRGAELARGGQSVHVSRDRVHAFARRLRVLAHGFVQPEGHEQV